MREIKFRFWHPEFRRMDYKGKTGCGGSTEINDLLNGFGDWMALQFTGLKDKNGKEIYEGDIVNHDSSIYPCEIIYKRKIAQFMAREIKKNGEFGKVYQISEKKIISVVGNIYEHGNFTKTQNY